MGVLKRTNKADQYDPRRYLSGSYIAQLLKNFEGGDSYLVRDNVIKTYGKAVPGWPDNTQFIMPKAEMDAVLRKTGGDLALIEKERGIPEGSWQGEIMLRIDIPDPASLNLRMPWSKEAGANEHWLPGGWLPGNYREAVIDCIPEGK